MPRFDEERITEHIDDCPVVRTLVLPSPATRTPAAKGIREFFAVLFGQAANKAQLPGGPGHHGGATQHPLDRCWFRGF